jgi:hypothetical protein
MVRRVRGDLCFERVAKSGAITDREAHRNDDREYDPKARVEFRGCVHE